MATTGLYFSPSSKQSDGASGRTSYSIAHRPPDAHVEALFLPPTIAAESQCKRSFNAGTCSELLSFLSCSSSQVEIVTEHCTSKTCTKCGEWNTHLGSSKVFTCPTCAFSGDRDACAARNILLRNFDTSPLQLNQQPGGRVRLLVPRPPLVPVSTGRGGASSRVRVVNGEATARDNGPAATV